MSNSHRIRANEPVWALHQMTLEEDPDDDAPSLSTVKDYDVHEMVHGLDSSIHLSCTCGKEFRSDYQAAENHLLNIRDSDNGEEVASMDVLRYKHALDMLTDQLVVHVNERLEARTEDPDDTAIGDETHVELNMLKDDLVDRIMSHPDLHDPECDEK